MPSVEAVAVAGQVAVAAVAALRWAVVVGDAPAWQAAAAAARRWEE